MATERSVPPTGNHGCSRWFLLSCDILVYVSKNYVSESVSWYRMSAKSAAGVNYGTTEDRATFDDSYETDEDAPEMELTSLKCLVPTAGTTCYC